MRLSAFLLVQSGVMLISLARAGAFPRQHGVGVEHYVFSIDVQLRTAGA